MHNDYFLLFIFIYFLFEYIFIFSTYIVDRVTDWGRMNPAISITILALVIVFALFCCYRIVLWTRFYKNQKNSKRTPALSVETIRSPTVATLSEPRRRSPRRTTNSTIVATPADAHFVDPTPWNGTGIGITSPVQSHVVSPGYSSPRRSRTANDTLMSP